MSRHDSAGRYNSSPFSKRIPLAILLAAVCGGLAACDHAFDHDAKNDVRYVAVSDSAKRHPIVVVRDRVDLALPLAGDGGGLEPGAYFQVTRFARQYRQTGKGRILVSAPPGHRYRGDVAAALSEVRSAIRKAGVTSAQIAYGPVPGDPGGGGPEIHVSFNRIAAIGPDCGDWSEDVTHNRETLPYPNFGCATQRNLAAMVAHPTDLIYPTAETPRPAERRAVGWRKYIESAGGGGDTPGSGAPTAAGAASGGGAATGAN